MAHARSSTPPPTASPRGAYSLVELLVVIAVIGTLVGLLLAAVQQARESARRSACSNNARQLVLAVHGYESARRRFPPSMRLTPKTVFANNNGSWGILGRVMPYLEEDTLAARIDLETPWDDGRNDATLDMTKNWPNVRNARVPTFSCPSERNAGPRMATLNGVWQTFIHPFTYGFNCGGWFVYDPDTGAGGDGAFHPNSNHTGAAFTDGLGKTLCLAEVKAFTPYVRNTSDPGGTYPAGTPPSDPAAISGLCVGQVSSDNKLGPTTNDCTGHTEWPDGRVHHAGFTTVFTPNTRVPHTAGGVPYDIDYNSRQEGSSATARTYAAITSRSHHPGVVVTAMMDGAAGTVSDTVELSVWRSLGTRAGGEAAPAP